MQAPTLPQAGFLRSNAHWLGAGALLAFSSGYGQTYFIALFAGHIREDFGLSHGGWGAIYALGTLVAAAVMLWAGGLTDQFRVRTLAPIILAALACAALAMAVNPWIVLLPVLIFALRLMGQGMTSHISTVAMSRWFAKRRGMALAIATLGFSVGEAVLPVIFVALMEVVHWRWLWVLAAGMALTAIPALLLMLKRERTPQSHASEAGSLGLDARHWTRAEMLRTSLFWFMFPVMIGPSTLMTAFFFQQVHFAEVKGLTHLQLVSLFPIFSIVSVMAIFAGGALLDKIGTARLMPLYQLPMALGFWILATADSMGMIGLGIACLALTVGGNATLPSAFWAEFYGTRYLGSIRSVATAVMVLGSALGPVFTGLLIDAGQLFPVQMPGFTVFIVLSCLCAGFGIAQVRTRLTPA